MVSLFQEIQTLKAEGKLHNKLLRRTRVSFIIATILGLVIAYNIWREFSFFVLVLAFTLSCVGFLLGLFVLSKMNGVRWNEEEEIMQSTKMDRAGFVALGIYIVFEIGLRTFLKDHFSTAIMIPLLLSAIFGALLGRGIGTLVTIHRVYTQNNTK